MTIRRIALFGASGDLTSRLIMPAIAQLAEAELLPPGLTITGSANTDWSAEDFHRHIADELDKHASAVTPSARDAVLGMLDYRAADVTDPDDVRRVLSTGDADREPALVYLALPSGLLQSVLPALATAGLGAGDAVAIEKPFGTDLASARHLNEILRTRLPLPTIFRVDHFLSDELVRRVMVLRFLNRVFEPTWNAVHVDHVDISWLESLALEGRASYYDKAGALKDMVQNHLMEVMALVLMEEPARIDADSFRGNRVEALRAVATPAKDRMRTDTVRARYTAGTIGERHIPSYTDEPGVDPARATETYASLTLQVDNARWHGTPFTLRSGKGMAQDAAEIAIHFRPAPAYLLDRWPGIQPNVLRLGLKQPYVRLTTTLNGPDRTAENRELELSSAGSRRTPYANLFLEMLRADATLFIRGDETEEAWRIIDPVVTAWTAAGVPMQEYPAGEAPPGPTG
ncbi:glucose-6-phosphate dehydrogenase [Kitasatospora purpeofusca]|uniref:glucose-6-phosphate dehydrogenase n=1 Tax=Kitasatospora purpeofusca TaxID=67352 RepID=UPI0022528A80|nr:glucose-6-phosphate dehydrogenase [Kitasatospora purpeofusca]MCX4757223.1 glucose-6-phosphate dehydrogenase [Kitasatospora purpeofusca]WSR35022.1 glucose-6-phosphate dehydrogenase [Kitasatospora purpeofusca]